MRKSRVRLTAERVAAFVCPAGKSQDFLWDTDTPTLALRATPTGRKTYVFESRLDGRTIRVRIGTPRDWPLDNAVRKVGGQPELVKQGARDRAQELKRLVDRGLDPREVARLEAAAKAAHAEAALRSAAKARLPVRVAWCAYLQKGKPRRRSAWKPRYLADLARMASPGGEKKKRGKGVTKPGPLAPLMDIPLGQICQDLMREWFADQSSAAQATRALAMFSGFLTWCGTRKEYRDLVDKTAARASELADLLPGARKRTDALELEQLAEWFAGARTLLNKTAGAYLQALLLTGARREELAGLKWHDVDFRWKKITLADKVEQTRTIPLSPYLASLVRGLPRVNEYVFASETSASGRLVDPRRAHLQVLREAGVPHLSLHGLRRSFALFGEAAGAPAGAIAQIMGHKPSAVHEGYKPRSLDLLRPYLAQVERFVLASAGIVFEQPAGDERTLRLVSAQQ